MKRVALSLFMLLATGSALAQSGKCNLGLDKSPSIRGFKLGMTKADAEAAFGGQINYSLDKSNDSATASVSAYQYPDKLDDVISINMRLFKEKIFEIVIVYAKGDFKSGVEVADYFSKSWNLPANAWDSQKTYLKNDLKPYIERKDIRVLQCAGWGLAARVHGKGNPKIEAAIFGVDELITQQAGKKRAEGFKP